MDRNKYEENEGAAAFSRRSLIFWIWGMVHLWPHTWPMYDLYVAYIALRSYMPSYPAWVFEHAHMVFEVFTSRFA